MAWLQKLSEKPLRIGKPSCVIAVLAACAKCGYHYLAKDLARLFAGGNRVPNSTQIITDLYVLSSAEFTDESIERANKTLHDQSLAMLVGIAMARAAELKTTLMKLERVLDPADPQLAVLNSILLILN